MPQVVTQYKAKDGSIWSTLEEAEYREKLIDECNAIEQIIGKRPKLKYEDFHKHDLASFYSFRSTLILLTRKYLGKDWDVRWNDQIDHIHPCGVIARILDDYATLSPISRLWNRWASIDREGVEWQQPFYANESNKKLGY